MKRKILLGLLFIAVELGLILVGAALSQEQTEYGPQVVMQVQRLENGQKVVEPKATVFFSLKPLEGPTSQAPLAPGDYMLCRQFNLRTGRVFQVAFRCGDDTYVLQGLGLAHGRE